MTSLRDTVHAYDVATLQTTTEAEDWIVKTLFKRTTLNEQIILLIAIQNHIVPAKTISGVSSDNFNVLLTFRL